MLFFRLLKLNPVFPPTDASTIASKEVGTKLKGTPLLYVDAAKAPISQITPPPIIYT